MTRNFVIIAHRGFSSKAPENTPAAFDLAIQSGFPNIELDVQLSSDGVPVIIHDTTLDRTTNGLGNVANYNLEALQQLDAGTWFDPKFKDERILTLDELLDNYTHKAHLHIELKSDEPELPIKVADTLAEHKLLSDTYDNLFAIPGITITSFNLEQLERSLSILSSRFTHSWLVEFIDEASLEMAKKIGVKQICPRAKHATKESVELALSNGFTVRGQGVKEDADIQRLYEAGAQGTTTNWPHKAQHILASINNDQIIN